jgi:steroid 5-alpha reductase family enzyme
MGTLQFHLFNIFWISLCPVSSLLCTCLIDTSAGLGQNFFLFSLSLPVYRVVLSSTPTLTITDWILFTVTLLDIGLEFVADNQQWAYQNFKSFYLSHLKEKGGDAPFTPVYPPSTYWPFALIPFTGADAHRGFITKGLWAWSRHPNFLFEQAFWVGLFFVSTQLHF